MKNEPSNFDEITHSIDFSSSTGLPVVVKVSRGGMTESIHRGVIAICDSDGGVYKKLGDIERPIYARSAIKAIQAIPVVESGASEAFGMDSAEIALCCASHRGEAIHVDRVISWLKRLGLCEQYLECGPQMPSNQDAAKALILENSPATRAHNNCSGKHAGMITTAVHLGEPINGYVSQDHQIQIRLIRLMEELGDINLCKTARGIDGCGIPVFGIPVKNVAIAMAKMADPKRLTNERQSACNIIAQSCKANPLMISGTGSFNSLIQSEVPDGCIVKTGAEGICTASIPHLGLGVCLKIDDGAGRAASALMLSILNQLAVIDDAGVKRINRSEVTEIRNWSGHLVGQIQVPSNFLF